MGGERNDEDVSTVSIESMVEIRNSPSLDATQDEEDHKYKLLWSKSKVYVHPTAYARDNIPGFLAIVRKEGLKPVYLIAWLPETLLEERGQEEWDKFISAESFIADDDDGVLVELPSKHGESYAFSIKLGVVYSLVIHAPSFSSWYGSISMNLASGETLPTLYFHDDESKSFNSIAAGTSNAHSTWGGEDFLQRLRQYSNVLRSSLQNSLFLVDPSRTDIETHTTVLFSDDAIDEILSPASSVPKQRRPRPRSLQYSPDRNSVLHQTLSSPASASQARMTLFQGFSQITRGAKSTAQRILSHPLAKPIVPHLPDPVKSFVSANGEWASWVEKGGVGEYESARVYLARWARIVAEEGERSRQRERQSLSTGGDDDEESSGLGVFEVIRRSSNLPTPRTTRDPKNPVDRQNWSEWFAGDGRPIVPLDYMRQEVFRRGCAYDVRQKAWPFILGVLPWDADEREREIVWSQRKARYHELKSEWYGVDEVFNAPNTQDERHRIDVDCRRTDRMQPMFAAPSPGSSTSSVNKKPYTFSPSTDETGAQALPNEHVEVLCEILLTYGFYDKDLGYVQGMSDLCAPIYVVQKADEAMTFWCFVAVMEKMVR